MQNSKRGLLVILSVVALSFVFLAVSVSANPPQNQVPPQGANNSNPPPGAKPPQGANMFLSQELSCRINFNIGVLNSTVSAFPNSSSKLQPSISRLQGDLSQIQSMNNTNVKNFAQSNYAGDMRNVVGTVQSWRSGENKRMTMNNLIALRKSYNQAKAAYDQCEQNVNTEIAQDRLQGYENQLANLQNKTIVLQQKGFNVSLLNSLFSDAQSQIIIPLQNALSSANNSKGMRNAVQSYCLYNGCVNGTNFHLDAKFNIIRASIVLDDLQNNSAVLGLNNATIIQAQNDLSDAQAVLNSVGTGVYQKDQGQTIMKDVQNASKLIVQLLHQAMKMPLASEGGAKGNGGAGLKNANSANRS